MIAAVIRAGKLDDLYRNAVRGEDYFGEIHQAIWWVAPAVFAPMAWKYGWDFGSAGIFYAILTIVLYVQFEHLGATLTFFTPFHALRFPSRRALITARAIRSLPWLLVVMACPAPLVPPGPVLALALAYPAIVVSGAALGHQNRRKPGAANWRLVRLLMQYPIGPIVVVYLAELHVTWVDAFLYLVVLIPIVRAMRIARGARTLAVCDEINESVGEQVWGDALVAKATPIHAHTTLPNRHVRRPGVLTAAATTLRLRLRPRTNIASLLAWPEALGRALWQFIAFFVGLLMVTDHSGATLLALLIWAPELRLFGSRQRLYLYGVDARDLERFRFWSVFLAIFVPGVIGGLVGLALVEWTVETIPATGLLYGLLLLRLGIAGLAKLLRPYPGAALASTVAAIALWFTLLSKRMDILGLICAVAGVIGITVSLRIRPESELRAEMRARDWDQADSRGFLT